MTLTAADILAKKKPVTQTVQLVLDSEVADEWTAATQHLEQAKRKDDIASDHETKLAIIDAEDELEKLLPLLEENVIELKFQSIGRSAYNVILDLHPATEAQKRKAEREGEQLDFNRDTFPAALVSACLVEPKMTEEDVLELFSSEKFNSYEISNLFSTALTVNSSNKVVDLKKGLSQKRD